MKNLKIGAILAVGLAYKYMQNKENILQKKTTRQDKEIKLVMCGSEIRKTDKKVIRKFEKKHPGVTVNAEAIPWNICQSRTIDLAKEGKPVNLAYLGSRTLPALADKELIIPVNIPDEQLKMYQPGVLSTVSFNGKVWGFPHAFSTKALFINCGLVQEAGLECVAPKNWDELYNMADAIHKNTSAYGIGLVALEFDNTVHQFLNYLYSNGGSVINSETGKITFNSKAAIETLAFYGKLASVSQPKPTNYEREHLPELYNNGKIGMYINGPWGGGAHDDNIEEIVVPIPSGPRGESGTILISDSIVVFKGSGNEKLAMELASDLTFGDTQYDHDKTWGLTPIMQYENILENVYHDTEYWKPFVASISKGGPEPQFKNYKKFQSIMNSAIQDIILRKDSAENIVADTAEKLEDLK
jgi:multiple sugar transport system substrate-binding protein